MLKKHGSETTSGQKSLYNPKNILDLIICKIATKKVLAQPETVVSGFTLSAIICQPSAKV
ncbi:MAG: hypothetical protein AB1711_11485 [Thermodesulfobacteriota bacterium]